MESPFYVVKDLNASSPPSSEEDEWSTTDSYFHTYTNVRNSRLWFDDGNVVLNAYDRTLLIRYQFKVHRTLISLHSPWWRDMFDFVQEDVCLTKDSNGAILTASPASTSLPTPSVRDIGGRVDSDGAHQLTDLEVQGGLVDGINPIEAGFSADPVAFSDLILRIYYPYESLGPANNAKTNERIHGMLLLAHQFGMDSIRGELEEHLSYSWPSMLADWDENEREIFRARYDPSPEEGSEDPPSPPPIMTTMGYLFQPKASVDLPDPVKAIALSRQCELSSILPSAFYALSRLSLHESIGAEWAKGASRTTDGINYSLLTMTDMLRLVMGREKLQKDVRSFVYVAYNLDPDRVGCRQPMGVYEHWSMCNEGIRDYWAGRVRNCMFALGMEDPIGALGDLLTDRLDRYSICDRCEAAVKERMQRKRDRWWKGLGSTFQLYNSNL